MRPPPKPRPPVFDIRKDPASVADWHVEHDANEGESYVIETRPPKSLAAHQTKLAGYDPVKHPYRFFDADFKAKLVEGIARPKSFYDGLSVDPRLTPPDADVLLERARRRLDVGHALQQGQEHGQEEEL
ncbi:MAG: hypothetical protein RIC85_03090 [Gammaproteobacteria bacterium]